MKKYNVCEITVETRTGKDALRVLNDSTNQTPDTVKSFDSLAEAQAYYETVYTGVKRCGNRLYSHACKYLEEVEVDEDGEFVDGGDWWAYDFPDYPEQADEEDAEE